MNAPNIPLHKAKVGDTFTPKVFINRDVVGHLTFARECGNVRGGLVTGTARLEVVEISPHTQKAQRWIKLAMIGTSPPQILKLTAEEFMAKFRPA
ncbi:MAG: hypothetical protein KDJ27_03500 [Gammaproteobacteria bacterium]|nr:hypothetical protein [Gammaproteobacteria bacterium]